MKLTTHDWRKLRLPLITFGAALIISTLIYSTTDARKTNAEQMLQKQQNVLNQARQRYQTSGTERENIIQYLPSFQHLVKQGFIGEEQRAHWMDDLHNLNIYYKLFGISYDIAPQQDYKPAYPLDTGKFILRRSVIKLSFSMLHELDLLTLLNALAVDESPRLMFRDCAITRVSGGGKGKFLPNLASVCEIDWFTLKDPSGTGEVSTQ
jgi:hypothetical protein